MSTPVLHLLAGSNGAGKSTLALKVLVPRMHLPFVNADLMAEELWPDDRSEQERHAHEVSALAAERRDFLLRRGVSFITETVFSHPSKVDLINRAQAVGYNVTCHFVLIPEELAVQRVLDRVAAGGHRVPEEKIRARYRRLWELTVQARRRADHAFYYDNTSLEQPFRQVAAYRLGAANGVPDWPLWTPDELR